jgi:hypothetical protein
MRLCDVSGRSWWELYGLVYRGKMWLPIADVTEMDVRPESRMYIVLHPEPPWPQGPVADIRWDWEGQGLHFALRMLSKLLEDHVSPFDFCTTGMQLALHHIVLPEDDWDGERCVYATAAAAAIGTRACGYSACHDSCLLLGVRPKDAAATGLARVPGAVEDGAGRSLSVVHDPVRGVVFQAPAGGRTGGRTHPLVCVTR